MSNNIQGKVVVITGASSGLGEARRNAKRPSLVYCGDDHGPKDIAATLIRDVGFDLGHR